MSDENNKQTEEKAADAAVEENKAPEAEAPATPETTPEEALAEAPAEEKTEEAPAEAAAEEAAPEETPAEEAPAEEAAEPEAEATPVTMPHRDLKPGMVVRVHEIIKDTNAKGEERQRVQVFEGTILGFAGSGIARTMPVRKVTGGIGVEKIYPLSSPHVEKVEVVKQLRVRRSKLWLLRKGKTKRRMKEITPSK